MKIIKPPIYPPIKEAESALGYLYRLAALNKYPDFRWLTQGRSGTHYCKDDAALASALDEADWSDINRQGYILPAGAQLRKAHLTAILRYCPLCIRESGCWNSAWSFKASACCVKHQVWLVDTCDQCGVQTQRGAGYFNECHCGRKFADSTPVPCPLEVTAQQQFLESGEPVDGLNCLSGISLVQRIRLIEFVSRHTPNPDKVKRRMNLHLNSIASAKPRLIDSANAFFSDEGGFYAYLKMLHHLGTDFTTFNYGRLQLFYQCFYKRFDEPAFNAYKSCIEQYINQNLHVPLSGRNILFSDETIAGHRWLPLHQAVDEYQLSKSRLKDAINLGWVEAKIEQKEKRQFVLVSRLDIECRIHHINNQLTAIEAAQYLGVTKRQIRELLQNNLIPSAIPPDTRLSATWRISRHAVDAFLTGIYQSVQPNEAHTMQLSQVLRGWAGSVPQLLTHVLQAIQARTLSFCFDDKAEGLRRIKFDKDAIKAFVRALEACEFYSIPEVACELKISQEFAYQLVNAGIINSVPGKVEGTRNIAKQELNKFKTSYCLLAKVSKACGLSSHLVKVYLNSRDIESLTQNDAPFKQAIYLRQPLRDAGLTKVYIENGLDWAV